MSHGFSLVWSIAALPRWFDSPSPDQYMALATRYNRAPSVPAAGASLIVRMVCLNDFYR